MPNRKPGAQLIAPQYALPAKSVITAREWREIAGWSRAVLCIYRTKYDFPGALVERGKSSIRTADLAAWLHSRGVSVSWT